MYECPVCGFNKLEEPMYLDTGEPMFVICHCCGFQSGYDDDDQGFSFQAFRNKWIEEGYPWFNPKKKPNCWDINKQLEKIKDFK